MVIIAGIDFDNGKVILAGLAFAGFVIVLLSNLLRLKVDVREPPVVYPTIPFIGHIIGMVRDGPQYFTRLRFVKASKKMPFQKLTSQ
jgi:hypothetical protein